MERLLLFELPIEADDLGIIEGALRNQQLFCTSFPEEDPYSLGLYLSQAEIHGVRAGLLLDRNVFARIVALARGSEASGVHQSAAAVMAFAQCADMLVEPALAVIEGDSSQLADRTAQDLALFYAADNMHPSNFADLAAGRARRLRGAPLRAGDKVNWTAPVKPIREYSFVYPCVLEMGLIEMAGGPMPERMRQFLDWTYRNWCFSPAATILAGLCFSGSAPKGVMKKLRDVDRSRALKGLRNCAWDLAYVTRWAESVKRQSQETRLHVFCSFDKALCRVARLMFVESNRSDSEDAVADKLRELLGVDTYDYYRRLIKCSGEDDRPANRAGCLRARQIVTELERQVVEAI